MKNSQKKRSAFCGAPLPLSQCSGKVQRSAVTASSTTMKSSTAVKAAATMEAADSSMEGAASMYSSETTGVTYGAAVDGMPRPAVSAVIEVLVVVGFKNPSTTRALPAVKLTNICIKTMVNVAKEKNRREAHVKR